MKPDIVFFHEKMPALYHDSIDMDKTQCDLLIVIGSSLKVNPVGLIPRKLEIYRVFWHQPKEEGEERHAECT